MIIFVVPNTAELIFHADGPVWTRRVALGTSSTLCPKVASVLERVGASAASWISTTSLCRYWSVAFK